MIGVLKALPCALCAFALASSARAATHPVADEAGLNAALKVAGAGDTIRLDSDIELNLWVDVNGSFTLDLNGHVLRASPSAGKINLINVSSGGGHLTVVDSAPDAVHGGTDLRGGLITGGRFDAVSNGGTLVIAGGTIAGNTGDYGAVYNYGSLTMTGGTITGNAGRDSGGVYNEVQGKMTVGGTARITGNTLLDGTTACNVVRASGCCDLD